jgi:tetratricopeptide (TPR) repeat protein
LEEAYAAMDRGQHDLARNHVAQAYALAPERREVAFLHASLLGRAGNYPEALSAIEKLQAQHPDYIPGILLEGILRELGGDRVTADQAYDRVQQAAPASGSDYDTRICVPLAAYLRLGAPDGVAAANQALEAYPGDAALRHLKQCMQDKDRAFLLRWFTDGIPAPSRGPRERPDPVPGTVHPDHR